MKPDEYVIVCETWKIATDLAKTLAAAFPAEVLTNQTLNRFEIPMVWTKAELKDIVSVITEDMGNVNITLVPSYCRRG